MPGTTTIKGHHVLQHAPHDEPELGLAQVLGGESPLQDDLVRPPVDEVEQVHAEQGDPRQGGVIPRQVQVHEVPRPAPQLRIATK
jgi:hypothetical protein